MLRRWQFCKNCNSLIYNITAEGNVVRTAALSPEQRARVGGMEYLLSELAPRLGTAEQAALVRALRDSVAVYLAGSQLETELRTQRPWNRCDEYTAEATRAALGRAHIALQLELAAAGQPLEADQAALLHALRASIALYLTGLLLKPLLVYEVCQE